MASSGTASFTVTRDEVIEGSLRLLRVLGEGDVPNPTQTRYAVLALQMLLKNMQSNGLALWTYQSVQIPMVTNQTVYTIGPVGADITTTRPLRLFDGSFIRIINNGVPFDTPLRQLSRLEYLQFGSKTSVGVPNSIYYFSGIADAGGTTSPSTGFGQLYVYVTPTGLPRTIFCNFQRPIYDINDNTQEFDFPQEWFRVLKYMLAADLALEFPSVPMDLADRIKQEAANMREEAQSWSTENSPIYFQPDMMMNWNGRH